MFWILLFAGLFVASAYIAVIMPHEPYTVDETQFMFFCAALNAAAWMLIIIALRVLFP